MMTGGVGSGLPDFVTDAGGQPLGLQTKSWFCRERPMGFRSRRFSGWQASSQSFRRSHLGFGGCGFGRRCLGRLCFTGPVLLKRNKGATHQLALKRVAGRERLGDARAGRGFRLPIRELVSFGIERLTHRRFKGNETHTAHGLATGLLELGQLVLQIWLA